MQSKFGAGGADFKPPGAAGARGRPGGTARPRGHGRAPAFGSVRR
jgi:hypothetical protein